MAKKCVKDDFLLRFYVPTCLPILVQILFKTEAVFSYIWKEDLIAPLFQSRTLHLLSHRAKYHTPPIKITDPTSIQTPLHTDSHQTHSLRNPIRSASSRPRACASHLPPQTLTVILSERTWQAPAAVYKYSKNVITHYSNTVYTPWPPLATARNDVDSESLQHFS